MDFDIPEELVREYCITCGVRLMVPQHTVGTISGSLCYECISFSNYSFVPEPQETDWIKEGF